MRRPLPVALVLGCLLAACGGGGSSGGLPPLPPQEAQQITQDIVTGCLASSVEDVLALQALVEGSLAAGGAGPTAEITGIDASFSRPGIEWAADVDGDLVLDTTGTLHLRNLSPAYVAQLLALASGGGDPATLLAQIPHGAIVDVAVESSTTLDVVAETSVRVENPTGNAPVPDTTWGTATTNDGACEVVYSWQDLGFEGLVPPAGGWPTASFDFAIAAAQGDVSGVVVMDGTQTATIHATLDPYGVQSTYLLDLATGAVVVAP